MPRGAHIFSVSCVFMMVVNITILLYIKTSQVNIKENEPENVRIRHIRSILHKNSQNSKDGVDSYTGYGKTAKPKLHAHVIWSVETTTDTSNGISRKHIPYEVVPMPNKKDLQKACGGCKVWDPDVYKQKKKEKELQNRENLIVIPLAAILVFICVIVTKCVRWCDDDIRIADAKHLQLSAVPPSRIPMKSLKSHEGVSPVLAAALPVTLPLPSDDAHFRKMSMVITGAIGSEEDVAGSIEEMKHTGIKTECPPLLGASHRSLSAPQSLRLKRKHLGRKSSNEKVELDKTKAQWGVMKYEIKRRDSDSSSGIASGSVVKVQIENHSSPHDTISSPSSLGYFSHSDSFQESAISTNPIISGTTKQVEKEDKGIQTPQIEPKIQHNDLKLARALLELHKLSLINIKVQGEESSQNRSLATSSHVCDTESDVKCTPAIVPPQNVLDSSNYTKSSYTSNSLDAEFPCNRPKNDLSSLPQTSDGTNCDVNGYVGNQYVVIHGGEKHGRKANHISGSHSPHSSRYSTERGQTSYGLSEGLRILAVTGHNSIPRSTSPFWHSSEDIDSTGGALPILPATADYYEVERVHSPTGSTGETITSPDVSGGPFFIDFAKSKEFLRSSRDSDFSPDSLDSLSSISRQSSQRSSSVNVNKRISSSDLLTHINKYPSQSTKRKSGASHSWCVGDTNGLCDAAKPEKWRHSLMTDNL